MGAELSVNELLDRLAGGRCLLCRSPRTGPALCPACLPKPPPGSFAAQLRSRSPVLEGELEHACLFDGFGQPHHICVQPHDDALIVIGRDPICTIAIVDRGISREHAALIYRADDRSWFIQDLGSRNGTSVDDQPVEASPRRLVGTPRIGVGQFEFRFFASAGRDPARVVEFVGACSVAEVSTVSQFQMRRISFAPTDGAGGFVTIERLTPSGRQRVPVALSDLDFALLRVLAQRYLEMGNFEAQARGWVETSELLGERLPFDTDTPTSNNLRGAIKRIRDKFRKHGIERVIESRQNVGYRLTPAFDEILV